MLTNIILKSNIILPELVLLFTGILSQMIYVFGKQYGKFINYLIISVLCTIPLILIKNINTTELLFNDTFIVNLQSTLYKLVIILFTIISVIIYNYHNKISDIKVGVEYLSIILFSLLGIFISISARDFLVLFCGLELQALAGYVITISVYNNNSKEAALKYFILGAVVSAVSLFGISYLYGFTGSLKFNVVYDALNSQATPKNIAIIIGAVLMMCSIFFKLSAAPLHIWTPDVYEGADVYTVNYFATTQKIGAIAVLINIINLVIGDFLPISSTLIKYVAVLSMVVGAVGGLTQTSIKRIIGYSTILNIGYMLAGISLHNTLSMSLAIIYIFIYMISTIGLLMCITLIFKVNVNTLTLSDMCEIGYKHKKLSICICIIIFSMIGIPPLAGFMTKYYIFYQAIQQHELVLVFIGILSAVTSAGYYLQIIRYMYFINATEAHEELGSNIQKSYVIFIIIFSIIVFITIFSTIEIQNYIKFVNLFV